MVYLFVVIQIYNKFSGFLLFFTIIYNLSLEMSDEPIFIIFVYRAIHNRRNSIGAHPAGAGYDS